MSRSLSYDQQISLQSVILPDILVSVFHVILLDFLVYMAVVRVWSAVYNSLGWNSKSGL